MANFYTDNDRLERELQRDVFHRLATLREGDFGESELFDFAPRTAEEAVAGYRTAMQLLGEICAERIAPNAREVDLTGPVCHEGRVSYAPKTLENHRALVEAGLYGMTLKRRFGGLNFPTTLFVMASEMVARADGGFACLWALQNCAETIAAFGTEEQQERLLKRVSEGATCSMDLTEPDAGSDLQAAMLRATWCEERQTWLLNGVKRFITNGDADLKLVLARTEAGTSDARGLSLFVVERASGGVTVRRLEKKLGIRGSATCELHFEDAPAELIGTRRMGLIRYVMSLMNAARLGIGAQSVGLAEAAFREAAHYAAQRHQFGRLIAQMAPIAELLLGMRTRIDAARALLYATAHEVDCSQSLGLKLQREGLQGEERQALKRAQRLADMFTPLLKLMAGEDCNRIAYDALQVFGGSGYTCDFPIERLYRDARVVTIYEGTSQMQVVAAMKYITDGSLATHLRERVEKLGSEQHLQLVERTERLIAVVQARGERSLEFHARRLVECGATTLMTLLLHERRDDERSRTSARHYTTLCAATLAAHEATIEQLDEEFLEQQAAAACL